MHSNTTPDLGLPQSSHMRCQQSDLSLKGCTYSDALTLLPTCGTASSTAEMQAAVISLAYELMASACSACNISTGWTKKLAPFILYTLTLPNINRFSNCVQNLYFGFYIFWKLTELCRFVTYLSYDLVLKIPPHLKCVATLPCEMWSVLKATINNKVTSITAHFKKLTTGNNVYCLRYCLK